MKVFALLTLLAPIVLSAQGSTAAQPCGKCAEWNESQKPLKLFGNTYFVGTHGLSAILIHSPKGSVLIDGGLPESAPKIIANIRELGFLIEDVRLIVNSHDHFDHAGGIAALQRASGASVAASPRSATVLRRGTSGPDDPQYGLVVGYEPVKSVRVLKDGETIRVGDIAVTAHFTGGHTPGGTSWSWQSCENGRCLDFVYADSQTPVSADGFFFTRSTTYPTGVQDFERGFAILESLPCDVLLTPHPSASDLWERIASRQNGNANALVDPAACKRYAEAARKNLAARIAVESRK